MATDDEINAAIQAFAQMDAEVEGRESGKALRSCWRAALEAAERERARYRIENCQHPNKCGAGRISSDGSSSYDWHCPDCGQCGHSETPPQAAKLIGIADIPRNVMR